MSNSNWTLRFPRTSREAYGHDVEFDENVRAFDRLVVFIAGVIVGLFTFMVVSL